MNDTLRLATPICLTIKSKREPGYSLPDPLELFNAVERAFDFDKMINPFIEVSCQYERRNKSFSYKNICRDLAGCDSNITGYYIGAMQINCNKGSFDKAIGQNDGGLFFMVKDSDMFGSEFQNEFFSFVNAGQVQKSIITIKDHGFFLSNRTKVIIKHIPPASEFEIFLYPTSITTLQKCNRFILKREGKPTLETQYYRLPDHLKGFEVN